MSEIITTYSDMVYTFDSSVALEHYGKLYEEYRNIHTSDRTPKFIDFGTFCSQKISYERNMQEKGVLKDNSGRIYVTNNSSFRNAILGFRYSLPTIDFRHYSYTYFSPWPPSSSELRSEKQTFYTISAAENEISKIEPEGIEKVWKEKEIIFELDSNLKTLYSKIKSASTKLVNLYWASPEIKTNIQYTLPGEENLGVIRASSKNENYSSLCDLMLKKNLAGGLTSLVLSNRTSWNPVVFPGITSRIDQFMINVVESL